MADESIRVRMYHVGFGDCFLVVLPAADGPRYVLIDCGVHPKGDAHLLPRVVDDIATLTGRRLDVALVSHAHVDHLSGFKACADKFARFDVKEVWMPWTEKPADPQAAQWRKKQAALGDRLARHFAAAAAPQLAAAEAALLHLAEGQSAYELVYRCFPRAQYRFFEAGQTVEEPAQIAELTLQVVGPPRDEKYLARMDPPSGERYLALEGTDGSDQARLLPFAPHWRVDPPVGLLRLGDADRQALRDMAQDDPSALAFELNRILNNTSLIALLHYRGRLLLFPGDAQYGDWEAWLDQETAASLLARVDFYKVSHHGSANATPKAALEQMTGQRLAAMVSTQSTPWPSIPAPKLMSALVRRGAGRVVRSDRLPADNRAKRKAAPTLPPGFVKGEFWTDYLL